MEDLKDILNASLNEEYSPLFNKTHNKAAADMLKQVTNLMKSSMSKDEVVALLDDIKVTVEKNY